MGDSNRDQLVKICQVLGTEGLFKYLKKYNLKLDDDYYKMIGKHSAKPWSKFIKPDNQNLCSEEALDLLGRMLQYDHAERIVPKEALQHKYFDPVRKWSTDVLFATNFNNPSFFKDIYIYSIQRLNEKRQSMKEMKYEKTQWKKISSI